MSTIHAFLKYPDADIIKQKSKTITALAQLFGASTGMSWMPRFPHVHTCVDTFGCPHTPAHEVSRAHTPEKSSPIDKKGHRVHSYVIYWTRRLLASSGLFLWQQRRTGSNLNTYPPTTHTHVHTHNHPLATPQKKQVFYSVDPIKGSFPEGAGTIKIKRESAKRTGRQKPDTSAHWSVFVGS